MNNDDKFLILASDGVWEFMSNDEVIDIVVPFWHRNDLKGACNQVVKEAVIAWEREEESIDDITCIIVFFKRTNDPVTDAADKMSQHQEKLALTQQQSAQNSKRLRTNK
jgi:serine/threonine protein phosphatase PrpC